MAEDAELDGLVIRNIGDISAAIKHAEEVLEPRIWKEAGKAMAAACEADALYVHQDAAGEDLWLTERCWLLPETAVPATDFWIGLGERTSLGGDGENSWLATFTGSGPNGATAALWVGQDIIGKSRWKKLVRNADDLVGELRLAGFEVDDADDRQLCLPVLFHRDTLAAAFESGDFDLAMQPLTDAVGRAVGAREPLSRLRDLALKAA